MTALLTRLLAKFLGSPWLLLAVALTLGAAGFAAGNSWRGMTDGAAIARLERDGAQFRASHEKARADGAEAAAAALTAATSRLRTIMETLARQEAAAHAAAEQFRQELSHAPQTYICGTSAAEHAYRRSVQRAAE